MSKRTVSLGVGWLSSGGMAAGSGKRGILQTYGCSTRRFSVDRRHKSSIASNIEGSRNLVFADIAVGKGCML